MASPKWHKKPVTSIPLEFNLAVAQAKQSKGKKKAEIKKASKKCSRSDASLGIPTSNPKKQKRKGMKKGEGETAGSEVEEGGKNNNAAIVKWANPDLHYLTSKLINMISNNRVWRQVFNSNTSDSSEPINSRGKKTTDHQCEIAWILLHEDPSGRWADIDLKTLGIVIKNRVNALIEEDREEDIWADSLISNAWDKTQKVFPWYKELSPLLRASPVLNKDAAANSASYLDLSMLITHGSSAAHAALEPWEDEASNADKGTEGEDMVEGVPGSPHLDETPPSMSVQAVPPPQCTSGQKGGAATGISNIKKGQPSLLDKASELIASQNAMSEVIKTNNKARKERKQLEANVAVQMKKMQLDHEMAMMERHLELEHRYKMDHLEKQLGLSQVTSSVSTPAMHAFTDYISDVPFSSSAPSGGGSLKISLAIAETKYNGRLPLKHDCCLDD
ncbi:hypothetical protein K439DRAFT_1615753 [Ramaria rubella]|nr:hypothetical protein K439DRAFT_1615753 [Ramaria rubella]